MFTNGIGYGFVRFGDEHEAEMACMEMTGKIGLGGKPIRVNKATPKKGADDVMFTMKTATPGVSIVTKLLNDL